MIICGDDEHFALNLGQRSWKNMVISSSKAEFIWHLCFEYPGSVQMGVVINKISCYFDYVKLVFLWRQITFTKYQIQKGQAKYARATLFNEQTGYLEPLKISENIKWICHNEMGSFQMSHINNTLLRNRFSQLGVMLSTCKIVVIVITFGKS